LLRKASFALAVLGIVHYHKNMNTSLSLEKYGLIDHKIVQVFSFGEALVSWVKDGGMFTGRMIVHRRKLSGVTNGNASNVLIGFAVYLTEVSIESCN